MTITRVAVDRLVRTREHGLESRVEAFAALFLAGRFGIDLSLAASQLLRGDNGLGVDAFHWDAEKANLYLIVARWAEAVSAFREPLQQLSETGLEAIFSDSQSSQDPGLATLRSILVENQSLIGAIFITPVFVGDPALADRSELLDALREDLESKKFLIDAFFDARPPQLVFRVESSATRSSGAPTRIRASHTYSLSIRGGIEQRTPTGERMLIGLVSLGDLLRIYDQMGVRFLERNIRAGLGENRPANRALTEAFERLFRGTDPPELFPFNHNGITVAAEDASLTEGTLRLVEPRLLNGAQTLTTLSHMVERGSDFEVVMANVEVLTKVIQSDSAFATKVAIANNRQNPVAPWNLRANDIIQLQYADLFRERLGLYYERQENSFGQLSDVDLEDLQVDDSRALEIRKLAQTFLAAQGEIDRMSRLADVFESDAWYSTTFRESYLDADPRRIVICYKLHYRLRRLIREIQAYGPEKYLFVGRASNLMWALLIQGVLNDESLENTIELFGSDLRLENEFVDSLKSLAANRIRYIFKMISEDQQYAAALSEGRISFLRAKATYQRCMAHAYDLYGWQKKGP